MMRLIWRRRPSVGVWRCLLGGVLSAALSAPAHADALDRAQATDAGKDDGLVHCLFPGQVRRLGAFATSVTPRRAARVPAKNCAAGGGEYIDAQDTSSAATTVWLPLAAEGVPEAQATLGELYERQGQNGLAKAWYEKASGQGMARAQFNLASLIDRGLAGAPNGARVQELLVAASGGLVAGLALAPRDNKPRVEFVSPTGAVAPLPTVANKPLVVETPGGPATVVARVVAPAGIATVKVNGQAQTPDAQGFLNIPVMVGDARVSLLIEAQDREGATAQAQLSMVQRSAVPTSTSPGTNALSSAPLLKGRRLALVIANQNYQHWPKLDTPLADAQSVSDILRRRFGFDVRVLQDATRQQLLAAMSRLRLQAGPEDQVLVYYAGHGQMDSVTARGYWIPVDGDEKDLAQWVSVIDVTDQLSAMTARHVMVIADSCYSGTLTRSLIPQVDQALSLDQRQAPLKQLAQQRVRVAMTSGGLEPVADGGSVDHSLFARSLLDMLDQVRAPVAAQELFQAVSSRFAHLAQRLHIAQQPQYAPIGFAGHEAGDFVLVPM